MAQVRHKMLRQQRGQKKTEREREREKERETQFIRTADEWRRRRRCRDANSRGNRNNDDDDADDVSVCVHDQRNVVATLDKKPSQQMRLPSKASQEGRGKGGRASEMGPVQLRALSGPLSALGWGSTWLGLWVLRCLQRQP